MYEPFLSHDLLVAIEFLPRGRILRGHGRSPSAAERTSSPAAAAPTAWCRARIECGPGRGATPGSAATVPRHRSATPRVRWPVGDSHRGDPGPTKADRA